MKIEVKLLGKKKVEASFDGYVVAADQPVEDGGSGSAPAPFDLFLASIATCAGYFVQAFCEARNLSTDGIRIEQESHWDEEAHLIRKIQLRVRLPEGFPERYRQAVIGAVNGCTVKKHLLNPPAIEVTAE